VIAPITQNLPDDKLRVFTNACLLLHVMVAYCINSTVITRALCDHFWPGMLTVGRRRPAVRWAVVSTSILCGCGLVALLVPFFSDLMNIWSSIGIFTLSFAVPSALYIMANLKELSDFAKLINGVVVVVAVVGGGFGVWAAVADIVDKWQHCDESLKF
jgi:proton-coupled amino acid transporter